MAGPCDIPAAGRRTRLRPIRPLDAKAQSRRPAPKASALGAVYFGHQKTPIDIDDGGLSACHGLASPPSTVQEHERRVSGARGETCLPLSCRQLYGRFELSPVPRTGECRARPVGDCGVDVASIMETAPRPIMDEGPYCALTCTLVPWARTVSNRRHPPCKRP